MISSESTGNRLLQDAIDTLDLIVTMQYLKRKSSGDNGQRLTDNPLPPLKSFISGQIRKPDRRFHH